MCKAPVLGKVKTRLASSVGQEVALEVYSEMLQYVVTNVNGSTYEVVLCLDGDASLMPWYSGITIQQRGDKLGQRLINAVTDVAPFGQCIVIGTDAPFVDHVVVNNSIAALETSDVVLGPALDGGYYLIGMSRLHHFLFKDIAWSTERVLMQTLERCNELNLRAQLLEPMSDIDTLGDVVALEAPSERHNMIVARLRAITMLLVCVLCLPVTVLADGGWTRKQDELVTKLSFQTLSTTTAYSLAGVKDTTPRYSLMSVNLYAEYGVLPNLMVVVNVPLFRSSTFEGIGSVGGMGDLALDVRYGIIEGDWPVSIGIGLDLPTGNEQGMVGGIHLPTGDGELNMWMNAGLSHSFWPTEAYISVDGGYNVRSLAVSSFTRTFDNGQFTNQYRLSVKGGYKILEPMWMSLAVYRLGTAGTPQAQRFTFNGLGEGVEFNAWDLGFSYSFAPVMISLNASGAFSTPRAIYGGLNLFVGLMATL